MSQDAVLRRLSAIMAADVVGYSRLMETDEVGTLARFRQIRAGVIDPTIAQFQGRIVGTAGDSLLVEFTNALAAVQCAVACQRGLSQVNATEPEGRRIVFRMGINLGDVIAADDTIHGDGVNVAARLEKLAEPGGLCIARNVYEQVQSKLDHTFTDLGEHQVKNIAQPIRVYRAEMDNQSAAPASATAGRASEPIRSGRVSIAVLPFDNMSGDPEQGYFSDGITEDIITELSRFRELFVIARNSSFFYKGKSTKVQDIGKDLDVTYIVEGSVRKVGQRIRITAQLIEAASGNHVWAERYDRELEDIFDLQDEITRTIVTVLPLRLQGALIESARRKPSDNLTAYDYYLRARWLFNRTSEKIPRVLDLLAKAVQVDPNCAHAYAMTAYVQAYSVFTFSPIDDDPTIAATENIERALALGEGDHYVHARAGDVFRICGKHELAKIHIDKALALNPNEFSLLVGRGVIVTYLGDARQGLQLIQKALAHDQLAPDYWLESLAETYYMLREYEKAIEQYQRWQDPPVHMYTHVAACYAQLDRMEEAHRAVATFEERRPENSDFSFYAAAHARICKRPEDAEHWLDGYRKAGLID